MKRAVLLTAALAAAACAAWAVGWAVERAVGQEDAEKPPRIVQTQTAERGRIAKTLEWSGTIEPRAAVFAMPKTSGEIVEIAAEVGDRVEAGDLLASIDDETLKLAAKQAEAQYAAARIAHEQTLALAQTRAQALLDDARARAASARKALEQMQKIGRRAVQLKAASAQAALDAAEAGLAKLKSGAREEAREQARSAEASAEASMAQAKNALQRAERLYQNGALSEQDRESAQTAFEVAKARRDSAAEAARELDNGPRAEDVDAMTAQAAQARALLDMALLEVDAQSWDADIEAARTALQIAQSAERVAAAQDAALSWQAEIETARANKALAEARWELAQKQWRDAAIVAPIAGVVSERRAERGGFVSPAAPAFEIMDVETVKAAVDVIDADLAGVSLGMRVWIEPAGAAEPVEGFVFMISPKANRTTRSTRVEIAASNRSGALRPGMFAAVKAEAEVREDAVVIPLAAVTRDSTSGDSVFLVEDGYARRRSIRLGLRDGDRVEAAEGLKGGEELVVAGQQSLSDGEPVSAQRR